MDAVKNFAVVTVSSGYDAAATSIALATGHGAKLPVAPFNLTWWNTTDFPAPHQDPNVEIVRVTAVVGDVLTVTRAQESTGATTKNAAGKVYQMQQAVTAALIAQIVAEGGGGGSPAFASITGQPTDNTNLAAALAAKAALSHGHANATTSADGFLSATDKTKLNGIETGATADMTGAEIVAAVNANLGGTTWQSGGGSGDELAAITASFTANGYTDFLPLNVAIVRIGYKVTGGNPTGVVIKDEDGTILAGVDVDGTISAVNLTAGDQNVFEGEPVAPYITTFGRLKIEATAWNGATLALRLILARLVDAPVTAVAPGVPSSLTLGNAGATTAEATCAAVLYALDYEYRWSVDEANWTSGITTTTPTVAKTLTGLPNNTLIYVQVRARNRIGNSAWSSSQTISTSASGNGLLTNLVAYWKLDEASGVADDIHAAYDLSDSNSDIGQDTTNKILGTGARTNAAGGPATRLTRGQHDSALMPAVFSIQAWVRATTIDGNFRLFAGMWRRYTNGSYALAVQSDTLVWRVTEDGYEGSGGDKQLTAAITANTWYHVVAGFDGTNMHLRVTAKTAGAIASKNTQASSGPDAASDGHFALFNWTDNAASEDPFIGQIDETGFWSRDLTDSDVGVLYNSGNGKPYSEFTS